MEPERFLLKDQLFNGDKLSALASEIECVHPEFRGLEFVAEAGDITKHVIERNERVAKPESARGEHQQLDQQRAVRAEIAA